MKAHVLFISFPVFASSLGFRIVVHLISRGGGEGKTLEIFLPDFIPKSSPIFYTVQKHCKIFIGLKVLLIFWTAIKLD